MSSKAARRTPVTEHEAGAEIPLPAPSPDGDLLGFIERFRATHDLAEMDAPGFTAGLRDPDPGPDVRL